MEKRCGGHKSISFHATPVPRLHSEKENPIATVKTAMTIISLRVLPISGALRVSGNSAAPDR